MDQVVLLYAETICNTNVKGYLSEAIQMFTGVLNEAVLGGSGCVKDETLMSSLKLQVDPLVSTFNTILTGPTTETNTNSEAF